jgi:hypothetical protein
MSNQENQEMVDTRPKIMTGYIHYGESDDLTKIFDVLNQFRKNNGLKYSHQSVASLIFFNISSEHLEAFSRVRPFKISRFQTRSEYKCEKETTDSLMAQKDSFLRMLWDENTGVLTFLSRTPSRVHANLVKRIFKDSGVEFQRDCYSVLKSPFTERNGVNQEDNIEEPEVNVQQDTPEGFQRVESKKTRKPRETKEVKRIPKVVKETETDSKPKIRGTKTRVSKSQA